MSKICELSLPELKKDFLRDKSFNEKVEEFKKLIKRYMEKQKEFEKENELFSPYCIGYGNITSSIWFMGEAEGGPCGVEKCKYKCDWCKINENSKRYNINVKTKNVLDEDNIKENVFTTVKELLEKHSLIKKEENVEDKYVNFKFAREVREKIIDENLSKSQLGDYEFFTEYWRYRVPGRCLEKIVKVNNHKWDEERENFLLELYKIFKPKIIIAYPPINKKFDNNETTKDKIEKLFKKVKEKNKIKIIYLTKNSQYDDNLEFYDTIILIIRWPGNLRNNEKEKIISIVERILKGKSK